MIAPEVQHKAEQGACGCRDILPAPEEAVCGGGIEAEKIRRQKRGGKKADSQDSICPVVFGETFCAAQDQSTQERQDIGDSGGYKKQREHAEKQKGSRINYISHKCPAAAAPFISTIIIINEKNEKAKGKNQVVTYVICLCDRIHYRRKADCAMLMLINNRRLMICLQHKTQRELKT